MAPATRVAPLPKQPINDLFNRLDADIDELVTVHDLLRVAKQCSVYLPVELASQMMLDAVEYRSKSAQPYAAAYGRQQSVADGVHVQLQRQDLHAHCFGVRRVHRIQWDHTTSTTSSLDSSDQSAQHRALSPYYAVWCQLLQPAYSYVQDDDQATAQLPVKVLAMYERDALEQQQRRARQQQRPRQHMVRTATAASAFESADSDTIGFSAQQQWRAATTSPEHNRSHADDSTSEPPADGRSRPDNAAPLLRHQIGSQLYYSQPMTHSKPFELLHHPTSRLSLKLQTARDQSDMIADFTRQQPVAETHAANPLQFVDINTCSNREYSHAQTLECWQQQHPPFQLPLSYRQHQSYPVSKLVDALSNRLQLERADVSEAMRLNQLGLGTAGFGRSARTLEEAQLWKLDRQKGQKRVTAPPQQYATQQLTKRVEHAQPFRTVYHQAESLLNQTSFPHSVIHRDILADD